MTFRKKIFLWSLSIVGLLSALLIIAVVVFVPMYLDSSGVKNKIETAVAEKLSGKVSYERVDISLFPRPGVRISRLRLAYPRTFNGTLKSIAIYPQLLPLFKGEVKFSKIRVLEPDFTIFLPAVTSKPTSTAPTLLDTKASVRAVLGYLQMIGPGVVVEMDDGKFLLKRNRRDFLSLQNVTVHFNAPPGDIKFLVKAGTTQWGDFGLSGAYSFTEERSEVRDLTLSLGRSSLTDYSAVLTWDKVPRFEIRSGKAVFALQEIYEWLSSSESLVPLMKEMSSIKGELVVTSLRGQGSISEPEKWRMRLTGEFRHIEFESPRLPAPVTLDSRFTVEDNLLGVSELSVRLGASSLSHVSAQVKGRNDPQLEIMSGRAAINITEIFKWRTWHPALEHLLQPVENLAGTFTLSSLKVKGALYRPLKWNVAASGMLDHIVFNSSFLPGQLGLKNAHFNFDQDTLSFGMKEATILDSSLTGTAVVSGITTTLESVDLTLNGSSGRTTLDWAFKALELPPALMVKTPLSLVDSHLVWHRTTGASFAGTLSVANGPSFFVDLSQQGADLEVRRLRITDQETKATIALNWRKQAADFSLSGLLAQSTLSRIFEQGTFGNGTLQGDLQALVRTDQPLRSRATGTLSGKDLLIPWDMPSKTTLDRFSLHADKDVLTIDSADVTWGKNHYSMKGAATTSDEGIAFSMGLTADGIDIQAIQQALATSGTKSTEQKTDKKTEQKADQNVRSFPMPPIRGDFRADSAYVKFGRFTFSPAHTVINVAPESVNMELYNTRICDISVPGSFLISRESMSFTFTPLAKKERLGYTVSCLSGMDIHITGEYDLSSIFQSHGSSKELLAALEGRVDFKAREGTIYRYPILARVLSVLSVLEIFRGKIPNLGESGFPYHVIALRGDIHKGIFTIEKAYIGGQSLDIIAEGEVDLGKQQLDIVVLVAPFSGLNWVIRHTPLLGKVMSGTLISIPVRVSGALANPDVVFLSPTAVGKRILRLMENIVKLPVDIVSPILPKGGKEKEKKQTR